MQRIWTQLIFRDHWQGEFSVALFGAIGFVLMTLLSPIHSFDDPRYRVLASIMPEVMWQFFFLLGGVLQLFGLCTGSKWKRLSGAVMVFLCLTCVMQAVVIASPWQLSIAMYAACAFTELCAIIFQTASIIRLQDYPWWWRRWIYKP